MKTYLDCIPCFFRQTLEACRLAGAGPQKQKRAMDSVSALVPTLSLRASPPELARHFYRTVRLVTGRADPYKAVKAKSNRFALGLYGRLKKAVAASPHRLRKAVETAIAGNIIDFGAKSAMDVKKAQKRLFKGGVLCVAPGRGKNFRFQAFRSALRRARTVLYLADNAGETVFDRVLIEEIKREDPSKRITYAVKGFPVINDALAGDAAASGIHRSAAVTDNGSDAPGTVLPLCGAAFRNLFKTADMVIAKGQGNYESLSQAKRRVFFLFTIKCRVVARDRGGRVGEVVLCCS